jgi:hypothetical protein
MMMCHSKKSLKAMPLFSERERGPRARTIEEITENCWNGIVGAIQTRLDDGSFGLAFQETCPDGNAICGVNMANFQRAISGLALPWPPDGSVPDTYDVLDLIEFCHEKAAQVNPGSYHSFFQHYHLSFNRDEGKIAFREEINRIFSRNGIAYELETNRHFKRLAPAVLGDALAAAIFKTGDRLLDELLETARQKFLDPKPTVRKEALEKLRDAWERLKTLEDRDKKEIRWDDARQSQSGTELSGAPRSRCQGAHRNREQLYHPPYGGWKDRDRHS